MAWTLWRTKKADEVAADAARARAIPYAQPEETYSGVPIRPPRFGLPKTTGSLCPECTKVIPAVEYAEGGKVWMKKRCSEHGEFLDLVYGDVDMYLKMEEYWTGDNRGIENPQSREMKGCPTDCGLCEKHMSHSSIANLDLTNRCNLTCPVCFANANAAGYLYEPELDQIRVAMKALRDTRPVPGNYIQFSGGEPTVAPFFMQAVSMAKEMGFQHIQCATNGIKFCEPSFAAEAKERGLNQLYLQFDGVSDDIYRQTRGEPLYEKKLAAVESCRRVDLRITLVATLVRGVNDHQVGAITKFAFDNMDIISGISFQPVTFTGRIAQKKRLERRFTLADLAHEFERQTGYARVPDDWFPLNCVSPMTRLASALKGEEVTTFSCHPHCAAGTVLFIDPATKQAVPFSRFLDFKPFLADMENLARRHEGSWFKIKQFTQASALLMLKKHFKPEGAPPGLTFLRLLQTLDGFRDRKYSTDPEYKRQGYTYKTMMIAGMHFMDSYNYDIERIKRCIVHYAAPNGRIYPFCTYNSGPVFREQVEAQFSQPWDPKEQRLKSREENKAWVNPHKAPSTLAEVLGGPKVKGSALPFYDPLKHEPRPAPAPLPDRRLAGYAGSAPVYNPAAEEIGQTTNDAPAAGEEAIGPLFADPIAAGRPAFTITDGKKAMDVGALTAGAPAPRRLPVIAEATPSAEGGSCRDGGCS